VDCEEVLSLANGDVLALRGFLGAEDLAHAYSAADFFVSASDFETFGFTVIESLACGTPVAVENAGGFVENVVDCHNGLLVNWDDAEGTRARLMEYSPGTSGYKDLLERVRSIARRQERSNSGDGSFTTRFLLRHAPNLHDEGTSSLSYLKKSQIVPESAIMRVLRWIYAFLTFCFLKTCAALFS
jgi:hypothetical protein